MTLDPEETARLREAFASRSVIAAPSPECPPPERIWAAVRGKLRPRAVRRLGLHAVRCPACAEAWRLARHLAAEALPDSVPPRAEPAPRRAPGSGFRRWALAGSAAAVLLAAAVLVTQRPARRIPPPAYRAPLQEPIQSLLPAGGTLPRDDFVLKWSGPEKARYTIQVATEDLSILARARDLAAGEFRVPREAFAGVPAGSRILWRVEAVARDGERSASRTFVSVVE